MAIFSDGFESGDFTVWTGTSGTPTVQAVTKHHGTYAALMDTANDFVYKTWVGASDVYHRAYIRFTGLTSGTWVMFDDSILTYWGVSILLSGGKYYWRIYDGWTLSYHVSTSEVSSGVWYCVECRVLRDGGSAGEVRLYIDGVSVVASTGLDNAGVCDKLSVCSWANDDDVYVDCVVVADTYIGTEAAGVTVKKGSNLSATMTEMLNSKMLFSIADRFPKLVPRRF